MTTEVRSLWETAPLWRGAIYLAFALSGVVIIELMLGVRGQAPVGGAPVPPPIATGRGTYASPFPSSPPPSLAPATAPQAVLPPVTGQDARSASTRKVRPTQDIDPSVLEELERNAAKKEPFAVMPGSSRPKPRTLEELQ
jgi:hypothetical protein